LIVLIGMITVVAILMRSYFERINLPSLVGFFLLGFILRLSDPVSNVSSEECYHVFGYLSRVGVICLLFRVGLESNLGGLLRQLPRASVIWVGNVVFSGFMGFFVCYYLIGLELISSLFVSVALTATSALLLGLSLIPGAEIAMVIMNRGFSLGEWAVPQRVFSAMVFVFAATCLIAPPVLSFLLNKTDLSKEYV